MQTRIAPIGFLRTCSKKHTTTGVAPKTSSEITKRMLGIKTIGIARRTTEVGIGGQQMRTSQQVRAIISHSSGSELRLRKKGVSTKPPL